jgi:predicted nucleic acid-binding protein
MLKITLDTTCLFDYFERGKRIVMEQLICFYKKKYVEIAITTRVKADTYGVDKNSKIWREIKHWIEENKVKVLRSPLRLGFSYLGNDRLADDIDLCLEKELRKIIGDNIKNLKDVDHLLVHIKDKRDIFVTSDKDFLNKREIIKNKFKTNILKPEECISFLRQHFKIAG